MTSTGSMVAGASDVLGQKENVRLRFPDQTDVVLSVREFEIEEGMSQLYRARVTCVSTNEDYDISALCGAKLDLELSGNVERRFRGICAAARFDRVSDLGDGLATYVITLVPSMWRLTQRVQNRLFQHVSIPAIVTKILEEWSIAHLWQIDQTKYPALELRTQYGESDFAFVSRLLEEAGISFFFLDAEEGMSKLVLADQPHSGKVRDGLPLPFVDDVTLAQRALAPQFITRVSLTEEVRSGRVTARDYDFMRPRMPAYSQASAARTAEHAHEQYRFMPGLGLSEDPLLQAQKHFSPFPVADDVAMARTRDEYARQRISRSLEAIHADRRVVAYETNVNDLSPGVIFRIGRHPRRDLSEERSFLCIRHHISGKVADGSSWVFAGAAVSTGEPWRPAQITPKPRIHGLQTAVVVGKEGASVVPGINMPGGVGQLNPIAVTLEGSTSGVADNTIYVDEFGRVRVQFPWDREHGFDKFSSMWMRVSQGWAGAGYGLFTIPRVGHEVLIAFLDGDPDCPIVVGRVHNANDPVPYPLPANMTVSTWKTASSPSGDGSNELRFDDASGREHVYLQAEKNMDQLVKNDSKQAVGGSATRYVQKHEVAAVGGTRSEMVNLTEQRAVGLDQTNFIGMHRTTHVGVEDNTLVGTRFGVTMARGMTDRLVDQLEQIAGSVGGVIRNSAGTVLGGIPGTPTADPAASPLAEMGAQLFDGLKQALASENGYAMDPGPPPTAIEMVDRQIKFSTGEASIILDGPNITLSAQGAITLHAMGHISVLGEKEIAIGGREKVAVVSATSDLILQAKNDLHLNPYSEGKPPREATGLKPPPIGSPPLDKCLICEGELEFTDTGLRSCPSAAGSLGGVSGDEMVVDEPDGGAESPAAATYADELQGIMANSSRYGFRGDVVAHAALAATQALSAVAPSFRRVLEWLCQNGHLTERGVVSMMELLKIDEDTQFTGLLLRYWLVGAEKPTVVSYGVKKGPMPELIPIDPGRMCVDVCLPIGYALSFVDQMALAELVSLFSLGTLSLPLPVSILADELPMEGLALADVIEEVNNG